MADQTKHYVYLSKDSSRNSFKTISADSYNAATFGEEAASYYPYSSSIDVKYLYAVTSDDYNVYRKYIYALKNSLDRNIIRSNHFSYSSSLGDKSKQDICLISIPGIFYGSAIQKGTIELSFFVSGTLVGKLQDTKLNGELIETTGSNSGAVAGVVLYNEGFIVLTGSWNLNESFQEKYGYVNGAASVTDKPKWIYWGSGYGVNAPLNETISSSFDLNFKGTSYISTITMLAHTEKGELNHSNNLTYIKYGELNKQVHTSSISYSEPDNMLIKNTTKYAYENYSGSLDKQTFITKIGIYDEKKNLIAVAKLSKPIRKTENRNFTFKLKLDI